MKQFTLFVTAAALASGLLYAQGPGRRGAGGQAPDPAKFVEMRVNRLAMQLSLTDDQKAQATKIFTSAAEATQTASANLSTPRQTLAEAVKANNVAAIDQAAFEIGKISGEITAIQSKAEAAFYAILTAEQKAKYDETARGGPGGRFGGPGMGPMGGPPPRWNDR